MLLQKILLSDLEGGLFVFLEWKSFQKQRIDPGTLKAVLAVLLLTGLTGLSVGTFFWVSVVGMLPGSMVYVYAGTQLATLRSMGDIASPRILTALILLGVFPLIVRGVCRGDVTLDRDLTIVGIHPREAKRPVLLGDGNGSALRVNSGVTATIVAMKISGGKIGRAHV